MSNQPVTPQPGRFQQYITLLEHIGEVGAEKIVPFADNLGSLINGFVPGVGSTVSLIIKAVGTAQADAVQAGQPVGSGSQKMARVLATVASDVSKTLDQLGRPSDTEAVRATIEQAVNTMKAAEVPAGSQSIPRPAAQSPASDTVSDQRRPAQVPQQVPQPAAGTQRTATVEKPPQPTAAPLNVPKK